MFRSRRLLSLIALSGAFSLAGCSAADKVLVSTNTPPVVAQVTQSQRDLLYIPPPARPIPIAVYGFADQTGQLRPSENLQSLSRAVTQGGTSILIKALRDAGNGNWFSVVERERLDNVLRERQIIREMRRSYLGEAETPATILPSLVFAGIILEGGIISYDSNIETGGLGARFLGIGGSTQYRLNTVTVYLRAVSVRTGEVLANVVTEKKVASIGLSAGAFRFVSFEQLLELESGVTRNEPMQIAVQGAIEKAVYALIMEGAQPGSRQLWSFADQAAGNAWLERYFQERQRALADVYQVNGGPPDTPSDRQPEAPPPVPANPAPATN